jgi:hypothetical protein
MLLSKACSFLAYTIPGLSSAYHVYQERNHVLAYGKKCDPEVGEYSLQAQSDEADKQINALRSLFLAGIVVQTVAAIIAVALQAFALFSMLLFNSAGSLFIYCNARESGSVAALLFPKP